MIGPAHTPLQPIVGTPSPYPPPCPTSGKLSFRSPERADKIRRAIKRRSGERLTIYRCSCGNWHLGHHLGHTA